MDLSIIIPVFNGELSLPELNRRIVNELKCVYTYEIIYIYDCGKDRSWDIIMNLISSDPAHIKGFHLALNYGQHNAILFGLTKAEGDFIVTLDEDLQHDPKFIKDLLFTQQLNDFDVVYGKFEKLQHPGMRVRTSEMLRRFLKIIMPDLFPDYSPYRLMKKKIAEKISTIKNSYSFIDGYISWATRNITYVPMKHSKRTDGTSSYSYSKLIKHAVLITIAYSKIKTWLLFSSLIFNLTAIGIYLLKNHINNNHLNNRFMILFLVLGMTLLILGILAEILHYRNLKSNSRPVEVK